MGQPPPKTLAGAREAHSSLLGGAGLSSWGAEPACCGHSPLKKCEARPVLLCHLGSTLSLGLCSPSALTGTYPPSSRLVRWASLPRVLRVWMLGQPGTARLLTWVPQPLP